MSWPSFATQSVTVQRAPLLSDHGDMVPDFSQTPAEHVLTKCSVQPPPRPPRLTTSGPHEVLNDAVLFAPGDPDLLDTDRVVFDGDVYAITGSIHRFATGVLDHVEAYLQRITPVA